MLAADVTLQTRVNKITKEHPELLGLLVKMGLEACCGGAAPLAEAAREAGRNPDEVLEAVRRALESKAKV